MSDDQVKTGDVRGVRGTCADQPLGPLMREKGEVSYVAAFPDTFVTHDEADARKNAETFRHLRAVCIYRIEIVDVYEHIPTPPQLLDLSPKRGA